MKKLKTIYKHSPSIKKYPGKVDFKIVVDTSVYDEWYDGLTEKEKIEYWNS